MRPATLAISTLRDGLVDLGLLSFHVQLALFELIGEVVIHSPERGQCQVDSGADILQPLIADGTLPVELCDAKRSGHSRSETDLELANPSARTGVARRWDEPRDRVFAARTRSRRAGAVGVFVWAVPESVASSAVLPLMLEVADRVEEKLSASAGKCRCPGPNVIVATQQELELGLEPVESRGVRSKVPGPPVSRSDAGQAIDPIDLLFESARVALRVVSRVIPRSCGRIPRCSYWRSCRGPAASCGGLPHDDSGRDLR